MMPVQTSAQQRQGASAAMRRGLAGLQARRSHAFAVGEALALERTISADAYIFLYKELVRLCKDGTRCWPGLPWLVARLGTSEGTLKRWLAELVKAGLINRTPRAGGMTTLTTVVPLQTFDNAQPGDSCDRETGEDHLCAPDVDAGNIFFLPSRERKAETPAGSQAISHIPLKNQTPNHGGGIDTPELDITESALRLQQAGVLAPTVLDELKHVPVDAIERCFAVARSRPHVVDAAGFAVALLRRGAAAKADGRRHSEAATPRVLARPKQHVTLPDAHVPAAGQVEADALGDTWTQVLDRLRAVVDGAAFETWCLDTTLEAMDNVAVVGAATCFQRDALEHQFNQPIVAALTASTGKIREVQFVVRSPRRHAP